MAVVWRCEDDAERALRQRRVFRDAVVRWSPHVDADAAELIFGELVGNALRHAGGAVELCFEVDGDAALVVRDHGPGMRAVPFAPRRDPMAESGRGLAIVEYLAHALAVEPAPGGGTVVRAVLPGQA